MARPKQNHMIDTQKFSGIMEKASRDLYQEIKDIAKAKGISAHLLIEIYLDRAVKQYHTEGF